jgi:hypothetical protein
MATTMKIVFINQSTGNLFVDIMNVFGKGNVLFTGINSLNEKDLQRLKNIRIEHIVAYNKKSAAMRVFTWLVASFQIYFKIITRYRKTHLFIVSNPPVCTLLPLFLKNDYSYLIYDIYPDILIRTSTVKEKSVVARWWKKANKRLIFLNRM